MTNKDTLLIIAGPSGCGKNYITEKLVEEYSDKFVQLQQYTTRPKRTADENTYYFIDEKKYNELYNSLMARIEINGFHYGTTTESQHDRINIVIANLDGINDIRHNNAIREKFNIFILGIDSEIPKKREERTDEYVKKERESLRYVADCWIYNTKEKYLTTSDVLAKLAEYCVI